MNTNTIFVVDTNVWLDHYLGYRKGHDQAQRFICEACRQGIELFIPTHCMKDIFFIVQQQLKTANGADGKMPQESAMLCARQTAWAILDSIMEIATVGPSGQSDARIASKHRKLHPDYEDNLVIATAIRVGARLLISNDRALIEHSSVATMNAQDAYSFICANTAAKPSH